MVLGAASLSLSSSTSLLMNSAVGANRLRAACPPSMVKMTKMTIRCDRAQQWLSTPEKDSNTATIEFDESMVGVKGIADSGLKKLPSIFVHESIKEEKKSKKEPSKHQVPIIDIGVDGASQDPAFHAEIINKLRDACEKWGFFQIVNHGIPAHVMEKIIEATIKFHEQDPEMKKLLGWAPNLWRPI